MPRDSGRSQTQNRRSHVERQHPDHNELLKTVEELEKQLQQKDLRLARDAERLKRNYGLDVSLDRTRSRSRSPRMLSSRSTSDRYGSRENHRHRNDRSSYITTSPIRLDSPDASRGNVPRLSSPGMDSNVPFEYDGPNYPFERPPGIYDRPSFEAPTHFDHYEQAPIVRYHDEVDVRVDEIPRWPMDGSPAREDSLRPSYPPYWSHKQDVRVEPLPVFPMNGVVEVPRSSKSNKSRRSLTSSKSENREHSHNKSRKEKSELQLKMIAEQASKFEVRSRDDDRGRHERKQQEEMERLEAREKIKEMREKAKKEKETEKRREAREKRHSEQRKEEKERRQDSRPVTSSSRKHHPSSSSTSSHSKFSQFESDELFMKSLRPAFGELNCELKDEKRNGEYTATCQVVNIPKELLTSSYRSRNRRDAREGAVCNYVDKLVDLGIFDAKFRRLMSQSSRFRKFIAEFVEPLCNDIAIFGTQISVTNDPDMNKKFLSFVREKCAGFWNEPNNCEKLSNFMKSNVLGISSSSSSSKRSSRTSRKSRERSYDSRRRSPSSDSSIEVVYSSNGNETSTEQHSTYQQQQDPSTSSNVVGPLPLMSIPLAPPVSMTTSYSQAPMMQQQYQMMSGYPQFVQPHHESQQFQQHQPGFQQSGSYGDSELMDEIFT